MILNAITDALNNFGNGFRAILYDARHKIERHTCKTYDRENNHATTSIQLTNRRR